MDRPVPDEQEEFVRRIAAAFDIDPEWLRDNPWRAARREADRKTEEFIEFLRETAAEFSARFEFGEEFLREHQIPEGARLVWDEEEER